MKKNNIAFIKAYLLSEAIIKLHSDISKKDLYYSTGNIGKDQWIFLNLTDTIRVRMSLNENANLVLVKSDTNEFMIQNSQTNEIIIEHITLERILAHAPEQLFFLLHKDCSSGCLFCPLTYNRNYTPYTWDKIQQKICQNIPFNITSISFTTACATSKTQDELVDEIATFAIKAKKLIGKDIPLGASLKTPSKNQLLRLKKAGISEMRLNLETYNVELAKYIMPNKNINDILYSIEQAVSIFGKEKVSSNIIVGLGETDENVLDGVNRLAEIGALATLYPYDSIGILDNQFKRPSAERIYNLALEHKKILEKHRLNPFGAETMCCACAASHLYPGKDI